MRKSKKTIIMLLFTLILCFPTIVNASSEYESTVNIPVKVELDGETTDEDFTFSIERKNGETNFLPENTKLVISNDSSKNFGPIVYNKPGVYEYIIKQIPGDNKDIVYDKTIYKIKVFVENEMDTNGKISGSLISLLILNNDVSQNKLSEIVFHNKYNNNPSPNPKPSPKTGIEGSYIFIIILAIAILGLLIIKKVENKNKRK
ncbi:MAG: Spy0128 family protein [Anaerococcus sp.]